MIECCALLDAEVFPAIPLLWRLNPKVVDVLNSATYWPKLILEHPDLENVGWPAAPSAAHCVCGYVLLSEEIQMMEAPDPAQEEDCSEVQTCRSPRALPPPFPACPTLWTSSPGAPSRQRGGSPDERFEGVFGDVWKQKAKDELQKVSFGPTREE